MYTTAQMITNRDLIARVVVALRERKGALDADVANADVDRQVDWLLARLSVEPMRDTRLVNIHVEHADPKRAAEIADLVAWYFAEYQAHQREENEANLIAYLKEQLAQVKEKIQRSEQMLLASGSGDPMTLEERIKQISQSLSEQQKNLALSNRELARAKEIYKDRHPRRIALETENEAIRQTVAANERDLANIQANVQRYSVAQSELKSDRELHTMLLGKLQEAEIDGTVQKSLVQLVQPAAPSHSPVRPRKALNIAVCLVAGSLLGMGLAFIREYLRRTIRTPDDVSDHLQLPVLGLIPKVAQP
jgi:capsular polysaccharide biosynthesis protein